MIENILDGYARAEPDIISRFESISSEELYRPVESIMPTNPKSVLDIGAGTGRDAAWFADRGAKVLAVEPVARLREAGMSLHNFDNIEWLDDVLPLALIQDAPSQTTV